LIASGVQGCVSIGAKRTGDVGPLFDQNFNQVSAAHVRGHVQSCPGISAGEVDGTAGGGDGIIF